MVEQRQLDEETSGFRQPRKVVEQRQLDEEKEWLPTAQVEWLSGDSWMKRRSG